MIAAILAAAMSNLSAALNSLASTTVMDFLRPLSGAERGVDESLWLKRARLATIAWGVILAGVALLARNWGGVLQAGLSIASIIYGSLLGVFLLGLLTRRVGEIAAMCGMVAGLALILYVRFETAIAFTWWVLIGTSMTFITGLLVSFRPEGEAVPVQPSETHEPHPSTGFAASLGPWSTVAIIMGTVIGSGIFLVPTDMVKAVGSPGTVFAVWVFGGVLSLFGALTYAELSAAMPEAGGEYAYLTAAYGPFWGFLYAWTQTWVAKSASIAALATAFYTYLADFLPGLQAPLYVVPWPIGPGGGPLEIRYGQLLAIGLILFLSAVNYRGVRVGGHVQVAVTALKVLLIGGVIADRIALAPGPRSQPLHFHDAHAGGAAGFFVALVAALWAYDGWNNAGMLGSEVENPQRTFPLALIAGVTAIIGVYLLTNLAYFSVLERRRGRRQRPRCR